MKMEKIQLNKRRDFGQALNGVFTFLKTEYKDYFKGLFIVSLPLILLISILDTFIYSDNPFAGFTLTTADDLLPTFTLLIVILVYNFIISIYTLAYLKSYHNNLGEVNMNEVWRLTGKYFMPLVALYFIVGLLIFIGFVFFILPGIYFLIALSIAAPVRVFESNDYRNPISRSFTLIKDHWWQTFGGIFVIGIIIMVVQSLFSLPETILGFTEIFTNFSDSMSDQTIQTGTNPVVYFLITFFSYLGLMASGLQTIYITLQYFNLVEVKEAPGLVQKVDELTSES